MPAVFPETVTAGELAKLFGSTKVWIETLHRDGIIPRIGPGKYPFEASAQALFTHLRRENRNSKNAGAEAYSAAKAREAEMRMAFRRRDLIEMQEARDALDAVVAAVLAELDGLATRFTRDLPIRRKLEFEIDVSRTRIADALGERLGALRAGGDLDPASSEADAGRMGRSKPRISRKRGRPWGT